LVIGGAIRIVLPELTAARVCVLGGYLSFEGIALAP
jgi:hypothetical protein